MSVDSSCLFKGLCGRGPCLGLGSGSTSVVELWDVSSVGYFNKGCWT